jgi:adenylate kinase
MLRLVRISSNFSNSSAKSTQKILFIFGPPGVGKGTYAKMMKNDLKLNHVSTGDEIRKILKGPIPKNFNPKHLETVRSIVKTGGLISD